MPELITNSRLGVFRECQRKHYYAYVRLRRPRRGSRALAFGTVVHAGLAAWFLAVKRLGDLQRDHVLAEGEPFPTEDFLGLALGAARLAFEREVCAELDAPVLDEFDLARAEALLTGYHARWIGTAGELEVLGVEQQFEAPLVNPVTGRRSVSYRLAGKLDAAVRIRGRESEGVWGVEHKTTSKDISPGAAYWTRLRMDAQVSTYHEGAAALGYQLAGFLYDVLAKPTIRQLRATSEEDRKYTQGKRCKACNGTGQSPIMLGSTCAACCDGEGATPGWKEPPRLYAGQRAEDETLEEFQARYLAAIEGEPDRFLARAEVVRLREELLEHAWDTWVTAKALHESRLAGHFPRNPDACFAHGSQPCAYWPVCTNAGSIEDDSLYRDALAHEELANPTPEEAVE